MNYRQYVARVGYVISNALPYIKVGYEGRPSYKIKDDDTSIRRNGFILGGGVDVAIHKNVFIRAEYVHGFIPKTNFSKSEDINGIPVNVTGNARLSSDIFLLGAAYKF